jgi:hypothetical protein
MLSGGILGSLSLGSLSRLGSLSLGLGLGSLSLGLGLSLGLSLGILLAP